MTFVVAECGINHNGSLDIAKQLIDAAKWAGADVVKFQKRTVDIVYAGQLDKPRESPWGKTNSDQKRGLEFSELQYDLIASYCESIKMPWFASAWDIPSLEFLRKYNLPWNKVASAMVKNIEFLAAVSWEHKPTFISTAMCDYDDIERALKIFSKNISSSSLTLMHCVGTYPCAEEDLNLQMIPTLQKRYIYPVGYSGHEASVSPSVIAAALGATAIERHLTLDRSMYGSDQAASLEPHGFKTMVDQIRKLPAIMGDGVKRILPGEAEVAKKLRYWS
jgi:N-acetylneuraminate synthase